LVADFPRSTAELAIEQFWADARQNRYVIEETDMKKLCMILAIALLSPCAIFSAKAEGPLAEGPLHWTARHVRTAAVVTGDTLANVGRTVGRAIDYRARQVHRAFE